MPPENGLEEELPGCCVCSCSCDPEDGAVQGALGENWYCGSWCYLGSDGS